MHPNKVFRQKTKQDHVSFAMKTGFGSLIVEADPFPLISHIPFLISEDGARLEAHLVRSNPMLQMLDKPVNAVISVSGPHAYISPDWYGLEDQVPTYNYVAVHLRGALKRLPQEDLPGILERLSANMEARLSPKQPWLIDKMTPQVFEKMCRMIVPIAMDIKDADGTWKLSQNKPDNAAMGAIEGLKSSNVGSEIDLLRKLMLNELNLGD